MNFGNWIRGGLFNTTGAMESLQIQVLQEGRGIYTADPGTIGNKEHEANWRETEIKLLYKKSGGAGPVKLKELLKQEGDFSVVMLRAGEPYQVFGYAVEGGRFKPHSRSAFDHEPRTHFLISRGVAARFATPRDMLWMEAIPEARWGEFLERGPVAAAGPTPGQLLAWSTPAAPERAPQATVTTADARMDAAIAAGSDVIALVTGSYDGVFWMRVGDTERRSLPGGNEYSAYGLGVAGKKIVLWRGVQLCVFDTETEQLLEISTEEVHLMKPTFKPYGPSFFSVDGMLVGALNDPNRVTARRMVKGVDLSGPEPVVISLQNPEIEARELNSIGVDGETGSVVVSSQRKAKLFDGPVVADTDLAVLDLSGVDGVSDNCTPQLASGRIIDFDDSGPSPRVRVLEPQGAQFRAFGSLHIEANDVAAAPEALAMASSDAGGSATSLSLGPSRVPWPWRTTPAREVPARASTV